MRKAAPFRARPPPNDRRSLLRHCPVAGPWDLHLVPGPAACIAGGTRQRNPARLADRARFRPKGSQVHVSQVHVRKTGTGAKRGLSLRRALCDSQGLSPVLRRGLGRAPEVPGFGTKSRSSRRGDVEDIGADGLEHGLGHAALSLRSRSRLPSSLSQSSRSLCLSTPRDDHAHDKDSYQAHRVACACKFRILNSLSSTAWK